MNIEDPTLIIKRTSNMPNEKSEASAIAFTLPLSCQICLGKVKQPVTCPNHHVFCGICMEVWLQRNKQCPACRVEINETNPCKKLLGGCSYTEEQSEFSHKPEIRRARMELLFKEYECNIQGHMTKCASPSGFHLKTAKKDEIERLTSELKAQKVENEYLSLKLNTCHEGEGPAAQTTVSSCKHCRMKKTVDPDVLMVLTKKLQDAQVLYDRIKSDMKKLKQENTKLKNEQDQLLHENQRLRLEIGHRSPKKYGRYTVAALEAELEREQKKSKQLEQALERSDSHIEELEEELSKYRTNASTAKKETSTVMNTRKSGPDFVKRNLFSTENPKDKLVSNVKFTCRDFHESENSDFTKEVTSDSDFIEKNPEGSSVLEFPSPVTPTNSIGQLSLGDDSLYKDAGEVSGAMSSACTSFSCKKSLRFEGSVDESKEKPAEISLDRRTLQEKKVTFLLPEKSQSKMSNMFEVPASVTNEKGKTINEVSLNSTSDAEISYTPELEDCLKLLNEAERKVSQTTQLVQLQRSKSADSVKTANENSSYKSNMALGLQSSYSTSNIPVSSMNAPFSQELASSHPPPVRYEQISGSNSIFSCQGETGQANILAVPTSGIFESSGMKNLTITRNAFSASYDTQPQSVQMTNFLKSTQDYQLFTPKNRSQSQLGMPSEMNVGKSSQTDSYKQMPVVSFASKNFTSTSQYDKKIREHNKRMGDQSDTIQSPKKSYRIS